MNRVEVNRLFALMHEFWPHAKVTKNRMEAWALGLEPYSYDDARDAVVAYARKNKFFPDLADVTAKLPQRKKLTELEREALTDLMEEDDAVEQNEIRMVGVCEGDDSSVSGSDWKVS